MPGLGDQLDASIGECPAELVAVVREYDPVALAPDDQCRYPHSVQPAAKAGIVHIRAPAVECCGRAVACDRRSLRLFEAAVVRRCALRIEEGPLEKLVGGERIDVGDVTLLARAELDAEGVDQRQVADPLDRANAHLERNPPAEG